MAKRRDQAIGFFGQISISAAEVNAGGYINVYGNFEIARGSGCVHAAAAAAIRGQVPSGQATE